MVIEERYITVLNLLLLWCLYVPLESDEISIQRKLISITEHQRSEVFIVAMRYILVTRREDDQKGECNYHHAHTIFILRVTIEEYIFFYDMIISSNEEYDEPVPGSSMV